MDKLALEGVDAGDRGGEGLFVVVVSCAEDDESRGDCLCLLLLFPITPSRHRGLEDPSACCRVPVRGGDLVVVFYVSVDAVLRG